jgi:PTH1 family peptidyl-tRNA hydrolase
MKLVVGIGNPGPEYDRTRHNVGFDVLDRLARRLAPGETARARFKGATVEADIDGEKVMLLKPSTYVNLSGEAVGEAVRFYKLSTDDVLVVVDDTALPCGRVRIRPGGGDGGHNGLRNISQHLGGGEWCRLRVGIDHQGDIPLKNYVLGKFRPEQADAVEGALDRAADATELWLRRGLDAAMNAFNPDQ